MVSPLQTLFDIWFSFHVVGGHFLIPVLLVTFLLSKAKRDATLINFGLTISFSSVINCLLSVVPRPRPFPITHASASRLYTHEYLGPEPNKGLCIVQAAAFGASAPMSVLSYSSLCFSQCLHVQQVVRCRLDPNIANKVKGGHQTRSVALIRTSLIHISNHKTDA